MEEAQINPDALINQMYSYASNLYRGSMNSYEVKTALMERGLDETNATYIVDSFEQEIANAYKKKAKKDMLYGALWCIGGTLLTIAHIGFIFWGAIIFGAVQFFKGVSNL